MLEKFYTAEKLPVGILDPTGNNGSITEIVGVFEVIECEHQVGADARPAVIRAVGITEYLFKAGPIDDPGQFHQLVLGIYKLGQFNLKQIQLMVLLKILRLKFARFWV